MGSGKGSNKRVSNKGSGHYIMKPSDLLSWQDSYTIEDDTLAHLDDGWSVSFDRTSGLAQFHFKKYSQRNEYKGNDPIDFDLHEFLINTTNELDGVPGPTETPVDSDGGMAMYWVQGNNGYWRLFLSEDINDSFDDNKVLIDVNLTEFYSGLYFIYKDERIDEKEVELEKEDDQKINTDNLHF